MPSMALGDVRGKENLRLPSAKKAELEKTCKPCGAMCLHTVVVSVVV